MKLSHHPDTTYNKIELEVDTSDRDDFVYCGRELELFRHAQHWKRYYASKLLPYIKGEVLEVGAGIGETSKALCLQSHPRWVLLEPDRRQVEIIERRIDEKTLPECCMTFLGLLSALPKDEVFDTILYIDVIEHIEDDQAEVNLAAGHLKSGGHLIILCPANQWLYSAFDQEIGHFRRYDKSMYRQLTPQSLELKQLFYLDSIGMLASMVNKLFLHQSLPTLNQVRFWDNSLVPISTWIDPLIGFQFGKSLIGIWQKS